MQKSRRRETVGLNVLSLWNLTGSQELCWLGGTLQISVWHDVSISKSRGFRVMWSNVQLNWLYGVRCISFWNCNEKLFLYLLIRAPFNTDLSQMLPTHIYLLAQLYLVWKQPYNSERQRQQTTVWVTVSRIHKRGSTCIQTVGLNEYST